MRRAIKRPWHTQESLACHATEVLEADARILRSNADIASDQEDADEIEAEIERRKAVTL